MDTHALSQPDLEQLTALEARIKVSFEKFFQDAGVALRQIRDKRLYRQQYPTFEAYCEQRWGIGRSYAYRIIEAAHVRKNLSTIGDKTVPLPQNEAQARPLASLAPSAQREAWEQSVRTAPEGKITAQHVQHTVHRHFLKEKTPRAKKPDTTMVVESATPPESTPRCHVCGGDLLCLQCADLDTMQAPAAGAALKDRLRRVLGEVRKAPLHERDMLIGMVVDAVGRNMPAGSTHYVDWGA